MAVYAYLRVSTNCQDIDNQPEAILTDDAMDLLAERFATPLQIAKNR